MSSSFLRAAGIWGQRVSDCEQGFYLYKRPCLNVHGGLWPSQRFYEELAAGPWRDPKPQLYQWLQSQVITWSYPHILIHRQIQVMFSAFNHDFPFFSVWQKFFQPERVWEKAASCRLVSQASSPELQLASMPLWVSTALLQQVSKTLTQSALWFSCSTSRIPLSCLMGLLQFKGGDVTKYGVGTLSILSLSKHPRVLHKRCRSEWKDAV